MQDQKYNSEIVLSIIHIDQFRYIKKSPDFHQGFLHLLKDKSF